MRQAAIDDAVKRFLLNEVDTIPQIEALLLFWESRPKPWTKEELAERLYVDAATVRSILTTLTERQFIAVRPEDPKSYSYKPKSAEAERLMQAVAETYRRDLVRATAIIHSKGSQAVREFARAFQLKKDSK